MHFCCDLCSVGHFVCIVGRKFWRVCVWLCVSDLFNYGYITVTLLLIQRHSWIAHQDRCHRTPLDDGHLPTRGWTREMNVVRRRCTLLQYVVTWSRWRNWSRVAWTSTSKTMLVICHNVYLTFLSRVSILLLTRDIDIVILSVCPSVCLSVTRWYCMKTA